MPGTRNLSLLKADVVVGAETYELHRFVVSRGTARVFTRQGIPILEAELVDLASPTRNVWHATTAAGDVWVATKIGGCGCGK